MIQKILDKTASASFRLIVVTAVLGLSTYYPCLDLNDHDLSKMVPFSSSDVKLPEGDNDVFLFNDPIDDKAKIKFDQLDHAHKLYPTVALNSPGGAIDIAVQLAKTLKEAHSKVLIPENALCASSCAILFSLSHSAHIDDKGYIGLHKSFVIDVFKQEDCCRAIYEIKDLFYRAIPFSELNIPSASFKAAYPNTWRFLRTCHPFPFDDINGIALKGSQLREIERGDHQGTCDELLANQNIPAVVKLLNKFGRTAATPEVTSKQ
ncbi:hypothetical protein [Nitrospirillum amazonense]|uniref:hypothetical protein n=1 Tax=Nitrospirillum amazonense TaxID=28077 RepID=UPI002412A786|nr:hypothetical protein [Nitrospirillum amazonense]MDG3444648.1 hypothetical protein [Nitrospirillum amazonense]